LNYDDKLVRELAKKCPAKVVFFSRKKKLKNGLYYSECKIISSFIKNRFAIGLSLRIPGAHNIENALAAAAISAAAGIKPAVIGKVLNSFKGVEHRIELCGTKRGVKYFNDSKATNVDSTRVALESFESNIWLILGGQDKGAPYAPLKKLIKEKVKGIFLIGEAAEKIKKELKGVSKFYGCQTLKNAVKKAGNVSVPGDIVLFSPACASFDQFKNYEDRGRQFKALVRKLA
jgi:UDP-N-acetylmuramoylalanine--D-glutamate ligase